MTDEATVIDPSTFREVMSRFVSGVVIVTGMDPEDGRPAGMTCQSFTSLSLDPPMVLFSAANTSKTFPRLQRSEMLAINILSADQHALSGAFARSGTDKFAGVAHHQGPAGTPLLDAALAHVVGRISVTHPGGDHTIVLIDVVSVSASADSDRPLVYYSSRYHRLASQE